MNKHLRSFLVRWLACTLGLWLAAAFLDGKLTYNGKLSVIVLSGLVLALVNMLIKPFIVLISLPVMAITLGLFMVVVNGLMVMLASWLYKPLEISGLWAAMIAGIIIGLVNFLLTRILEKE